MLNALPRVRASDVYQRQLLGAVITSSTVPDNLTSMTHVVHGKEMSCILSRIPQLLLYFLLYIKSFTLLMLWCLPWLAVSAIIFFAPRSGSHVAIRWSRFLVIFVFSFGLRSFYMCGGCLTRWGHCGFLEGNKDRLCSLSCLIVYIYIYVYFYLRPQIKGMSSPFQK